MYICNLLKYVGIYIYICIYIYKYIYIYRLIGMYTLPTTCVVNDSMNLEP